MSKIFSSNHFFLLPQLSSFDVHSYREERKKLMSFSHFTSYSKKEMTTTRRFVQKKKETVKKNWGGKEKRSGKLINNSNNKCSLYEPLDSSTQFRDCKFFFSLSLSYAFNSLEHNTKQVEEKNFPLRVCVFSIATAHCHLSLCLREWTSNIFPHCFYFLFHVSFVGVLRKCFLVYCDCFTPLPTLMMKRENANKMDELRETMKFFFHSFLGFVEFNFE